MLYKNRKPSDLVKMFTRAIDRAKNQGIEINPGNFGVREQNGKLEYWGGGICAVGAVAVGKKDLGFGDLYYTPTIARVSLILNENPDLIEGISTGFMGCSCLRNNKVAEKGWKIGKELRKTAL